ncbi:hypothetical protein [Dokdonella soli]|uniref:hypothetical protein n=1 Tax=Dokdonella soli TaxID=529810 RepID=UPI0031D70A79
MIAALAIATAFLAGGSGAPAVNTTCVAPIGDVELYRQLAKDPYFPNGFPPPNMVIRIERGRCGFTIHLGRHDPDEFSGDVVWVDGNGRIVSIVHGY